MSNVKDLEDYVLDRNNCPIEINKGMRGGIRVRHDSVGFEIDIKSANGDVEYIYCNKIATDDHFRPYIGIVASN